MIKTGLEIVQMMADGRAPKKIKRKDTKYTFDEINKEYSNGYICLDLIKCLNDEFEIEEASILTEEERSYLKSVMSFDEGKPDIIKKVESADTEYILIEYNETNYNDCDFISLRIFKKGTKFKGMEVEKEYTLKELGLEDINDD